MTATATALKIPDHLQRAMEDADRVGGWRVVCMSKSVIITPPGRKKGISFSLTKPPTADQVRFQLDRAGLYGALKKLQPEENSTELPEPEPERGMVAKEKTETEKLVCPECDADHFTRPASLAAHRKMSHGVPGTSKATKERNRLIAKNAAPAEKTTAKRAVPAAREPSEEPITTAAEAPAAPAVALSDLVAEQAAPAYANPEIAEAVEALVHAVTKTAQNSLAPLEKKIEEQGEQIAALQDFKDKVEAEIANGHQGPIPTLAKIIEHGGEGFGTPKA